MAEVLVLVEHTGGEPKKVTGELLTLANRLGRGERGLRRRPRQYEKAKDYLARFGAAKVYVAEAAGVRRLPGRAQG